MKITVHHRSTKTTLHPSPSQTFGSLTQQYVEKSLLHPPLLLQLLTSLHPDERCTRYQFRYGDGYATLINVDWSSNGLNGGVDIVDTSERMVEANATLTPRSGALSKLAQFTLSSTTCKAPAAAPVGSVAAPAAAPAAASKAPPKDLAADLYMEKISVQHTCGCYGITQCPFPIDEGRVHVLSLREHGVFEGVVDTFHVGRMEMESEGGEGMEGGGGVGSEKKKGRGSLSGRKRKESPAAKGETSTAAATKSTTATSATTASPTKSTKKKKDKPTKDAAAATSSSKKSKKSKEEEDNAKKKASPIKSATKPPAVAATAARASSDWVDDPLESSSTEKSVDLLAEESDEESSPKKKKKKKAAEKSPAKKKSAEKSPAKKKAPEKSPAKKSQEKNDKKKSAKKKKKADDDDEVEDEAKPPAKKARKSTGKSAGNKEEEEEAETNGKKKKKDEVDKPKRPLNGYMRFSNDVRSRIRGDNPDLGMKEIMKLIGKAYKELPERERTEYNDRAKAALMKFKEEHPDLPKSTRKKKKKKGGDDEVEEGVAKESKTKKAKAAAAKDDDDEGGEGEEPPVATVVVNSDEASVDEQEAAERKRNMPKRPLNGYMRFASEVRSRVKQDNPDLSMKELMSKIGEEYRNLDDDTKKQYGDAHKDEMKAYNKKVTAFKERYGEDSMKQSAKKKKGKGNKAKKESKKEDASNENNDEKEEATNGEKKEKASKKKRKDSLGGLSHIPSQSADDLPDGWTVKDVPRGTGDKKRNDRYWFSPVESYKFRSRAQIKRFRESLDNSGGDEVAAFKLYNQLEKDLKAAKKVGSSAKKSKKGKKDEAAAEADESAAKSVGDGEASEPSAWGA